MANNKKKTAGRAKSNSGTTKAHRIKIVNSIVNADCLTTLRIYAKTAERHPLFQQLYMQKFHQLGKEFSELVEECTNIEELDFLVSEMESFNCEIQAFECKVIENHRKFLEDRDIINLAFPEQSSYESNGMYSELYESGEPKLTN